MKKYFSKGTIKCFTLFKQSLDGATGRKKDNKSICSSLVAKCHSHSHIGLQCIQFPHELAERIVRLWTSNTLLKLAHLLQLIYAKLKLISHRYSYT